MKSTLRLGRKIKVDRSQVGLAKKDRYERAASVQS